MSREYWPEELDDPRDSDGDHALNEHRERPITETVPDIIRQAIYQLEMACNDLQGSISAVNYERLSDVMGLLHRLAGYHSLHVRRRCLQTEDEVRAELDRLAQGEPAFIRYDQTMGPGCEDWDPTID